MGSNDSKLLKIGHVAIRTGVTTRTLRYYESLGLINPASRSAGGFRLYDDSAVQVVSSIQALKEAGLSLDEIGRLCRATRVASKVPASDFLKVLGTELGQRRRDVQRRVESLQERLRQFDRACDAFDRCPGCSGKFFDAGCLDCLSEKIPGFTQVLGGLLGGI